MNHNTGVPVRRPSLSGTSVGPSSTCRRACDRHCSSASDVVAALTPRHCHLAAPLSLSSCYYPQTWSTSHGGFSHYHLQHRWWFHRRLRSFQFQGLAEVFVAHLLAAHGVLPHLQFPYLADESTGCFLRDKHDKCPANQLLDGRGNICSDFLLS